MPMLVDLGDGNQAQLDSENPDDIEGFLQSYKGAQQPSVPAQQPRAAVQASATPNLRGAVANTSEASPTAQPAPAGPKVGEPFQGYGYSNPIAESLAESFGVHKGSPYVDVPTELRLMEQGAIGAGDTPETQAFMKADPVSGYGLQGVGVAATLPLMAIKGPQIAAEGLAHSGVFKNIMSALGGAAKNSPEEIKSFLNNANEAYNAANYGIGKVEEAAAPAVKWGHKAASGVLNALSNAGAQGAVSGSLRGAQDIQNQVDTGRADPNEANQAGTIGFQQGAARSGISSLANTALNPVARYAGKMPLVGLLAKGGVLGTKLASEIAPQIGNAVIANRRINSLEKSQQ